MYQSFNTTVWLIQSMLMMLGIMFAIPLIRALCGIALLIASTIVPRYKASLSKRGIALLPMMLRVTLGVAVLNPLAQPTTAFASVSHEHVHIVQSGETLWSIAADRLASTSTEPITAHQIDREWRRLWKSNFEHIGGDPNALPVGLPLLIDGFESEHVDVSLNR
jgi:hypothetical protein